MNWKSSFREVFSYDTNEFHTIKEVEAKIIRCIYKDEDGVIWLGTYGNGLLKYNPKTKTVQQILKYVADDVWCITKGNKNE